MIGVCCGFCNLFHRGLLTLSLLLSWYLQFTQSWKFCNIKSAEFLRGYNFSNAWSLFGVLHCVSLGYANTFATAFLIFAVYSVWAIVQSKKQNFSVTIRLFMLGVCFWFCTVLHWDMLTLFVSAFPSPIISRFWNNRRPLFQNPWPRWRGVAN